MRKEFGRETSPGGQKILQLVYGFVIPVQPKKKRRKCLGGCGTTFRADDAGNALCGQCNARNAKTSKLMQVQGINIYEHRARRNEKERIR